MSPSVRTLFGFLFVLLAGCVGNAGPPALVLQLSQITRTRGTERAHDRKRELAFTASLSVDLEAQAAETIETHALDPPSVPLDAVRCEPIDSAICVWARSAEESAWLAAREHVEPSP